MNDDDKDEVEDKINDDDKKEYERQDNRKEAIDDQVGSRIIHFSSLGQPGQLYKEKDRTSRNNKKQTTESLGESDSQFEEG